MKYGAFGLVEVLGDANAVLVTDRMLKAADVIYETKDTKCGGHALVFIAEVFRQLRRRLRVWSEMPHADFSFCGDFNSSEEMIEIVEEFKNRCRK